MGRPHYLAAETAIPSCASRGILSWMYSGWRHVKPRILVTFALLLALPGPGAAGMNQEFVPGSRLVFAYYDLRPGFATLLFFTNVSYLHPASVQLEFYDVTCVRRDSQLDLTPGDIDQLDMGRTLTGDPSGAFRQGFVDAFTFDGDVLLGEAFIVNTDGDWAIAYPAAPARRVVGGPTPFQPYPSRLILPAFLTPGQLGPSMATDGMLILVAPHPASPGGELPAEPIQASLTLFFEGGRHSSGGVAGHQVIVPIGQLVSPSLSPTLGWIDLVNHTLDEFGNRFGLIGLYIQTAVASGAAVGVATRLWGVSSPATGH